MEARETINTGRAVLGIEFGSTRIKAVLIDEFHQPIAQGDYSWENRLENGIWTYHLEDIWEGLAACYAALKKDVADRYGLKLSRLAALGVSGMMHGYLAFDREGDLLVPFRTWRNTMTETAADRLTELFAYHIPQRWSIAHLYQAILNREEHVGRIDLLTTLAGYVHWKLTGERVLGIGDASGMFPIDENTRNYRADHLARFHADPAVARLNLNLTKILPKPLSAGQTAGYLTEEGARCLDPEGDLTPGIPLCPPEGDAGTGMVATNTVAVGSGNISAGTSIFAMVVMDHFFPNVHRELDLVTTPDGKPVAMAHCNNGTSDLNAWVRLFADYNQLVGIEMDMDSLYGSLYGAALTGEADCGGLISYNYFSGEHVTDCPVGRPMQVRRPEDHFTLANFMRSNLYSSMATLKIGMDILLKEESVPLERMYAHGGLFKTRGVGQRFMAAALDTPISLLATASEGGSWGIAVLAAYLLKMRGDKGGNTVSIKEPPLVGISDQGRMKSAGRLDLADYLEREVFCRMEAETLTPDPEDVEGFERYMRDYKEGLIAERIAGEKLQSRE